MGTFSRVDVSGRNRPGSDKSYLDFPTKSDMDMTVTHWDVLSKVTYGTTGSTFHAPGAHHTYSKGRLP